MVPIVFALEADTLYFAVDSKPKKTTRLARLKNIAAPTPRSRCSSITTKDDWTKLWWVRADGAARVVTDDTEAQRALDLLAKRYAQHAAERPAGPVVAIHIDRVTGWTGK